MDREELIRMLMDAAARGDAATAKAYLSDNFVLTGPLSEPLNADQWLGMHQLLVQGIPDFSFNVTHVDLDGDTAYVSMHITGTHSQDLDLTPMGMPRIPATGIYVVLPSEHPEITFDGDQVVQVHLVIPEGGGVMGILSQLGVQPPQ